MNGFKFYRKWKGGTWYHNRFWTNAGVTCIFYWSRTFFGYIGGNLCTVGEENY